MVVKRDVEIRINLENTLEKSIRNVEKPKRMVYSHGYSSNN